MGAMTDKPYANPPDLQFGKGAAEKEELLDSYLDEGKSDELMEALEHEQHQSGDETPRPGNKAKPDGED